VIIYQRIDNPPSPPTIINCHTIYQNETSCSGLFGDPISITYANEMLYVLIGCRFLVPSTTIGGVIIYGRKGTTGPCSPFTYQTTISNSNFQYLGESVYGIGDILYSTVTSSLLAYNLSSSPPELINVITFPGYGAPGSSLSNQALSIYGSHAIVGDQATSTTRFYTIISPAIWQYKNSITVPGTAYGRSVAVNENYALVGAPGTRTHGSVFVYFISNQTLVTTLTGTSVGGVNFGHSISLYGSLAAIGAPDQFGGKVFLVSTLNWQVVQEFRDEDYQVNVGWKAILYGNKMDVSWLGAGDPTSHNSSTGGGVFFFTIK